MNSDIHRHQAHPPLVQVLFLTQKALYKKALDYIILCFALYLQVLRIRQCVTNIGTFVSHSLSMYQSERY